jgi:hypothetical protein
MSCPVPELVEGYPGFALKTSLSTSKTLLRGAGQLNGFALTDDSGYHGV